MDSKGYTHGSGKVIPPEPPWRAAQESSQNLPPLPPPSTPAPLTDAEKKLQDWIAEMKKQPVAVQENLTSEMQAMMQSEALQVSQRAGDNLLASVHDLSSAREALDQARLGQHQLHVRWKDFLSAAVQRWQEYTSEFQREEQEYFNAIEEAKNALALARKTFDESKHTLGSEAEADCMIVEKEVENAKDQKDEVAGQALREGLNTMAANLVSLKESAEARVAQEQLQAPKRQRVDTGEPSSGAAHSSNAMEPFADRSHFAAPGKQ